MASSLAEDDYSHHQNITALVYNLIAKLAGREGRKMNPITLITDDTDSILAYNLSSLLMENYEINDTDLLEMIKNNLQNQESRLSYATFIVIVVVYVI